MGMSPTFNIGDLTPYLKDEDDGDELRENHNQEGGNEANAMPISVQESSHDGVPTTIDNEEGPTSPTRFNSSSKVQVLAQVVEESLKQAAGLKNQFLPGFVHLIT